MATIRVFEELEIWQMARAQSQGIFLLMEDGRFDLDTPLRDQINRSSGSVMDNIAEGFDRFSKPDFRHFLIIARGSNAEVRSQLYRASDRKYLTVEEAAQLIKTARQLGAKINSLIHYLDQSIYKAKPKASPSISIEEPGEAYLAATEQLRYELPQEHIQPDS